MNLFDVNCFTGRWPTEHLGCTSVSDLQAEMARLGIHQALVRHTWGWWYDPMEGNRLLCSLLESTYDLRPCLAASPLIQEELGSVDSFLRRLQEANAGAVCLYPRSQNFSLTPQSSGTLLEALQAMSMPLLLEAEETSWTEVQSLTSNWPHLPVVVTRTGYRILRQVLPLLRSQENLLLDIAYLADNGAVEYIASSIGADRLLFGTGTPRTDGSGALARLTYCGLSDGEKEMIAAGNLERLLCAIRFEPQE